MPGSSPQTAIRAVKLMQFSDQLLLALARGLVAPFLQTVVQLCDGGVQQLGDFSVARVVRAQTAHQLLLLKSRKVGHAAPRQTEKLLFAMW